jgi:hypothetical protein
MISEGEEVQDKGIHNILKINNIEFPKSQESFAQSGTGNPRTPSTLDQDRTSPWHIIIKTSTENRVKEY